MERSLHSKHEKRPPGTNQPSQCPMPKRIPPELGTTQANPSRIPRPLLLWWQTQFVLEPEQTGVSTRLQLKLQRPRPTPYARTQQGNATKHLEKP